MNKQLTTMLVGLAAASVFAAPVPKAIKMQYDGIEKAMRKMDTDAFAMYMSEDFWAVSPKGEKQNKMDFVKEVRDMLSNASKVTPMVTFKGSKMRDGMVDVMFDFHMTTTMKGGGKTTIHEVGTDTWKKVNGKWLCCKTVDKVLDIKMPKMKGK